MTLSEWLRCHIAWESREFPASYLEQSVLCVFTCARNKIVSRTSSSVRSQLDAELIHIFAREGTPSEIEFIREYRMHKVHVQ